MVNDAQNNGANWEKPHTLDWALRCAVIAALEHCNYCCSRTAKRLGCGRSTLYRHISNYEIPLKKITRKQTRVRRQPAAQNTDLAKVVTFRDGQYLMAKG
ncbi:helix-turn-helix domain-containing protein [Sphingomonas sp. LB2R24]|uniref:helix-turn-helix domain-containing protein n=1 Tax=Sphingomonas sorbitolis TaxID=3096165 RepID=UPI002FC7447D